MRQALAIESVGAGGFRVGGVWRPGSLLILADEARDWRPANLAELAPGDFAEVVAAPAGQVELVVLGVGPIQALPPRAVREALRAAGLGLDFMATDAAVRLHNVLASPGRRIATALIAICAPGARFSGAGKRPIRGQGAWEERDLGWLRFSAIFATSLSPA